MGRGPSTDRIIAWAKDRQVRHAIKRYVRSQRHIDSEVDAILADLSGLIAGANQSWRYEYRRQLSTSTGHDQSAFRRAELLAGLLYPAYHFSDWGLSYLGDEEFSRYYERFMPPGNWNSFDRKFTLRNLLLLTQHLTGDLGECGVWNGGTAYLLCEAARESGGAVVLFDSFEGLSQPAAEDGNHWESGDLSCSETDVRENLAEFDDLLITRKGWIPEAFPLEADRTYRFAHIDVDLYQPTLDALRYFYERTVPGGVILFDDYGFVQCPGAKKAVDDFLADKPELAVDLPTGQAFIQLR